MPDASEMATLVVSGNVRTASRVISLIEREDERACDIVAQLFPATGSARTIGITGPPGAGKSTLVKRFIDAYRERGLRVGVLAVDPSSHSSGGALLGDRLRMVSHTRQEHVFIRSMAVRDQHGGIALGTTQAMRVLDALGCERLIVETVGVGQSEIAVAEIVDCTLLVSHPGAGDEIQAMKSGIMEIGDLYAINKADQPGADHLRRQLMSAIRLLPAKEPPRRVMMISARTGEGVPELVEAVESRLDQLQASGMLGRQRLNNLSQEVHQLVVSRLVAHAIGGLGPDPVAPYLDDLEQRRMDPSRVASLVLARQCPARAVTGPGAAGSAAGGAQ